MFSKKPANVRIGSLRVGSGSLQATSTKKGTVLRTDISCGAAQCRICAESGCATTEPQPLDSGSLLMIPDSNVLLLYTSVLEDAAFGNIVFASTVLSDVQRKNKAVYARLQRLVADKQRRHFVFSNNYHAQTACSRLENESDEEFETRSLKVLARWYTRHLASDGDSVVRLVTHSEKRKAELADSEFVVLTFREFVPLVAKDDGAALLERVQAVGEVLEMDNKGQAFTAHLPEAALLSGIDSGAFVKGKLKVSESSCFNGEIRGKWNADSGQQVAGLPRPTGRILLLGRYPMNRAIADDVVVVQPLPFDQWRAPWDAPANSSPPVSLEEAVAGRYTPTARVVGILVQNRRPYCGSIQTEDIEKFQTATGAVSVLVQPKSNRIPRIRIQTKQLADLKDKRLSVVIDDWPENSAFPLGHYVDVLGRIGDKETEAKVILIENDIPHYDFSQAVYDCLPKGQWKVETEEEASRLDLRAVCVCSVDPLGCRDIDDALHWRELADGSVEVGVHIADVTHFLREGLAMDEEAQKRSTSVYLVDRRINMLPQLLTENLCSIVGGEDRYAFSFIWVFAPGTTTVVRQWYGKTIIRSRAALYYGDAQRMIDDPSDTSELAISLRGLMTLSRELKNARTRAGALFLASQEFKFKTDDDHLNPTDMTKYQTFEANSMIEEWMLYANVEAARVIHKVFPRWALLRRHQPPDPGAFQGINDALQRKVGMVLDCGSSLSLNQSLDRAQDPNDPFFNELVRMLTTRCLKQAQYFSSGEAPYEEYLHYGLAMPIYTHFTSPIRRYADVIVHRQLAATLRLLDVSDQHTNVSRINAIAENLNYRHEQAQKAGRDSKNLFTGFYLRNFPDGRVPPELGYIIKVADTHFFVLVPRYGQESKVEKEDVPDAEKYQMLDRVAVGINLKQDGDILRTKLVFTILGGPEVLTAPSTAPDSNLTEALSHEEQVLEGESTPGAPATKRSRRE